MMTEKTSTSFEVACSLCGDILDTPGGLAFSPPQSILPVTVAKYHICVKCWPKFVNLAALLDVAEAAQRLLDAHPFDTQDNRHALRAALEKLRRTCPNHE